MDASPLDPLQALASIAHDLRTPLSAISGEIELALRRDRSPAAYREALIRIRQGVAQLIDLTGDLAFLGKMRSHGLLCSRTARLDVSIAHLAARYARRGSVALTFDVTAPDLRVVGDEELLTRALELLVDHAIRHRITGAPVCLHVTAQESDQGIETIALVLDAAPPEFSPHDWRHLARDPLDQTAVNAPGLLPLQTAARIVRACGGDVHASVAGARASVQLWLRKVALP